MVIDITTATDADLNALLGLPDDAETIDEAIELWVDARTSCKPREALTTAERAGFYLWSSKVGALDHTPRPVFAQDCARFNGEAAVADFINSLTA